MQFSQCLNVRYAPDSDRVADMPACLKCATSGHSLPRRLTGVPQNGQKWTGCSSTASPPPCSGVFATVSLSTPSSMKKCRPFGNDMAVAMFLQQESSDFFGSDKATRCLSISAPVP